jgi:tetratricopeptide (TPR) repeat protein
MGKAIRIGLLSIALDNLSRRALLQSQLESDHPFTESLTYLNRAVDGLRQAGTQHHIPSGLLARAELRRTTGALDKAQKDLDEAFSIATRGGMGLHLADCHLEYARLYFANGDKVKAREHWQIAKDSVEKMGYHRRDEEVQELEEQLNDMSP